MQLISDIHNTLFNSGCSSLIKKKTFSFYFIVLLAVSNINHGRRPARVNTIPTYQGVRHEFGGLHRPIQGFCVDMLHEVSVLGWSPITRRICNWNLYFCSQWLKSSPTNFVFPSPVLQLALFLRYFEVHVRVLWSSDCEERAGLVSTARGSILSAWTSTSAYIFCYNRNFLNYYN